MNDFPQDTPLPKRCPKCGAGWNAWGTSSTDPKHVTLICFGGCNYQGNFFIEPEEVLAFEIAMHPDGIMDRKVIVIGAEQLPEFFHWPNEDSRVGLVKSINYRDFVVVAVDPEYVHIQPLDLL
jgi:hypothetical protein